MSTVLLVIGTVFVVLAALFHIYVFFLESIAWTRPATWKVFGIRSQQDADTIKPMAFNQGFYNLFLTIGILVGVALLPSVFPAGIALMLMGAGSMVLAGLILLLSAPKSRRSALLQAVPPFIGIVLVVISLAA
ncbi:MAG: rane protein [Microbacteriaceae bacterium]|nr:rane protein [Microbacteriaceae bacterium]